MTFERDAASRPEIAPAASPVGPLPTTGGEAAAAAPDGGPAPVQLRMQILTTEHWSLLASRGLAWNETFARAGMYLSTLSGAMVALGLVAGVDRFGDVFVAFALVILPVVLFVGIATWLRMSAANYHDAVAVAGMNRIRGAYLELAPELEPYFVMGVHDDPPGIALTMAVPPRTPEPLHLVAATPFLVSVLNSVVAGAIAAVIALRVAGLGAAPALGLVAAAAGLTALTQARVAAASIRRSRESWRPLFPTPAVGPGDGTATDGRAGDRAG